jgi:hypothetical protein
MSGYQVEDFCLCPDDAFDGPRPHYGLDCPAHNGEIRSVATELSRWGMELDHVHLDDVSVHHGRLADAIEAMHELLGEHWRHDPPGPDPSPVPDVCGTCGNTGEIHGPGGNGNWTGEPCGCMTAFCGGCGGVWPCEPVQTLGRAVGSEFAREDVPA